MKYKYLLDNRAVGYGSMGDEVVLAGVLNRFERQDCVVRSHDPTETREMHGIPAVDWHNTGFEFDTLVIGGGAMFWGEHATLICRVINDAADSGHPVIVHAIGIIDDNHDSKVVADTLKRVASFSVRDVLACEIAERRYGIVPVYETAPSADVEPCPNVETELLLDSLGIDRSKPTIGLNLTSAANSIDFAVRFVNQLGDGYNWLGIATCNHKVENSINDIIPLSAVVSATDGLLQMVPGPWRGQLAPPQLVGLISKLDLMLSMRKHPAFVAYFNNTPVILLDAPDDQGTPHRLAPLKANFQLPLVHMEKDSPDKVVKLVRRMVHG